MDSLFYSTGQAARELGIGQAQIRALCDSGEIETDTTRGGQRRVPKAEVERIKHDGVPSVPRPLPGDNPRGAAAKARQMERELPEYASDETIEAADEVVRLEAEVRSLGLKRQREEALDWFRRREKEEAAEEEAEQAEERARIDAEQAERQREEWLQRWEAYALDSLPARVPPDIRLEVHQAVRERLARLSPIPSAQVTRQLVDSISEKALAGWRRMEEIEEILLEARDRLLPYDARGEFGELSDWQRRVVREAGAAIGQLPDDALMETIRAVTRRAVEKVTGEFEADKVARVDAEMRETVVRWASLPAGLPAEARAPVMNAIAEAVNKLPPGTPRRELEEAREAILAPVRQVVAEHEQEQAQRVREQQEEARKQREEAWKLSRVESRLNWRLSRVDDYLRELAKKGDLEFDDFTDKWETGKRLKEKIQPVLLRELLGKPEMTDEEVHRRIEELVDEHLDALIEA